jgi:IS4 transposase
MGWFGCQDGHPLRRYRHRWKIERLFAWLQSFRRLVTRYKHSLENFTGMLHFACAVPLAPTVPSFWAISPA